MGYSAAAWLLLYRSPHKVNADRYISYRDLFGERRLLSSKIIAAKYKGAGEEDIFDLRVHSGRSGQ